MNPSAEFVQALPVDQIAGSPFNPRAQVAPGDVAELAESIKANGLLQPVVVRPVQFEGKPYQLIAGHRRLAAAIQAGLDALPAIIREATDADVKAAHLVENLQRENLKALEEAEGYRRLRDDEGLSATAIAARVGKKPGVVYNRLKLLELAPEARAALESGDIGAEVAVLVARLGSHDVQTQAVAALRDETEEVSYAGDAVLSYRGARELLLSKFTLDLRKAIFSITDGTLVPGAGACEGCPKRSDAEDLFVDPQARKKEEPRCEDSACFNAKRAAHLAREAAKLQAKGATGVDGDAARKALAVDWNGKLSVKGAKFVSVDDVKLSKAGDVAPVVLQHPETGKTIKAYKASDLEKAGVKVPTKAEARSARVASQSLDAKRAEEEAEKEQARRVALFKAVRERIQGEPITVDALRVVAKWSVDSIDLDEGDLIAKLWGKKAGHELEDRIAKMDGAALTQLIVDCVLIYGVSCNSWNFNETGHEALLAIAKRYGVELPKDEPAEAAPAKKKGAKK